ncbi:MAG TPA: acetamidase/formamidase family protein [Burkholderiales bacterium]|nr:acetamidase/formamidase family protein [Burkholderiales bacterium]
MTHALRCTPRTVVWGHIVAGLPAALTIRSGDTVRVDTVSHQGLMKQAPAEFFADMGIAREQVLADAAEIYRNVKRREGAGSHVLTGPLYVEDAAPGDMLEVRVLDVEFRVPYGVNSSGPGSGVLPELLSAASPKLISLDLERRVARFAPGVEVPLAPFMGIMAVAPPPERSPVSTKPPGPWGGNMDFRQLTQGSRLYLPVFNAGAQFFTGDGHACQGDGEVNGTAIEISLAPTLQFVVHKDAGREMHWPRAEDAAHWYVMGMDADLDVAVRLAVDEAVRFLTREARVSTADAYALSSLAVDFRVGEAVNNVKMAYGAIPKRIFNKEKQ